MNKDNSKIQVYIIHGWTGDPEKNWFPWLKQELEKRDIKVTVPAMPDPEFPKREEWLAYMQALISNPDENVYLVGHSLGSMAILRYLEALEAGKKIGGIILTAVFSRSIGIKETDNFFDVPLDYKKVKNSVKNVVVVNSDNDPHVPLEEGRLIEEKLGAKLVVLKKAGHINYKDGFFELPVVLEELLRIVE